MSNKSEIIEDYLRVMAERPSITQAELARYFDVSRATVCNTITRMRRDGLIMTDDTLTLTDEGADYAQEIARKYDTIRGLCLVLGMNSDQARAEADRLEHVMSDAMLDAMREKLS